MRCVHCSKPIKRNQPTHTYKRAGIVAHLACVSVVSASEMDDYLFAFNNRPTRLVYSTGVR